jgi:hypothetical protein
VGAIRLYEGLMEILIGASGVRASSASSLRGPPSAGSLRLAKKYGSTHLKTSLSTPVRQQVQPNLGEFSRSTATIATTMGFGVASPLQSDRDDMKQLLQNLIAKVDHLTGIVEGKQKKSK